MNKLNINQQLKPYLDELNITDINCIVKDYLLTEVLFKISQFKERIEFFEKKYNKTFSEFSKEYKSSEENFEQYDDLMEWEFAVQGYKYWNKKLEEIRSVI